MYIGCLFDTNDKLADEYRGIYDILYFAILMKVSNDYEMIKDEYKKLNKEMRLIYRKKI